MIKKVFYLLIFVISCSLLSFFVLPSRSHAFLFGKKEAVLARVGDKTITRKVFLEKIKRVHMSPEAGEALAKQSSFEMANFRKLLDELIDDKLMVLEAEKVGLDETRDFTSSMDTYILNLSLERLRQDEILDKVKVTDRDIEGYYTERLKWEVPDEIPPGEKEGIRRVIYSEKVEEREKEYREYLKKRAKIEIDRNVIDSLSLDMRDKVEGVVAYVNNEPIPAVFFLQEWRLSGGKDETKERFLDTVIVRKLLDQEALKQKYYKEEELKKKIEKKREALLIDSFRMKVILPLIEVEESEVKNHYETNKDRFREPDYVHAQLILLHKKEEADEISQELKAGADFSFLAKKRSADPSSKKRGGDIGWVPLTKFPEEVRHIILETADGELVGPFFSEKHLSIWKIIEKRKGSYIGLDRVRRNIDIFIGREKFKTMLEEYLAKLREAVSIEINEEELKKLEQIDDQ
ncbi:MAG: peptidyl-prolyl cis-trans isomerase [Thermodesulfobacteriota bacterium]